MGGGFSPKGKGFKLGEWKNKNREHSMTIDKPTSENGVFNSLQSEAITLIKEKTDELAGREGRRPRILVTGMDQKGNDRTIEWIAFSVSEMGFDVDINLTKQTPREVAGMAVENDVHFICISIPGNVNPDQILRLTDALKEERG